MIKIIMHGCNGKMGQVISSMLLNDDKAKIVAGIDPNSDIPNSYPVFSSPDLCTINGDVIIDFSISKAIPSLLDFALKKSLPMVICTTGLDNNEIDKIKSASEKIPILFSANMSLGVNLLINLAKKATEVLTNANFDIEIIEKHHNQKIDSPSGTALAIANAINEKNDFIYKYDRSTERVKREKKEIGIHAIRGGTIVGEHSIIYAGKDEILELKHIAMSRDIFAVGAINAAKFLVNKKANLYTMADLIE